jgi:hypothetical protein
MLQPPPTIRNVPQWEKRCRKVRALAGRIILGEVGVIEGSRQMTVYSHWLHAHDDPDFNVFVALDDEATHLPIGKVRSKWDPTSLIAKDQEIASLEARYRDKVVVASTRIREKYE